MEVDQFFNCNSHPIGFLFTALNKQSYFNSNGNGYDGKQNVGGKVIEENLGWDRTSQVIKEAFSEQQGLLSANILYERNTGKCCGYGFVSFEIVVNVKAALIYLNLTMQQLSFHV